MCNTACNYCNRNFNGMGRRASGGVRTPTQTPTPAKGHDKVAYNNPIPNLTLTLALTLTLTPSGGRLLRDKTMIAFGVFNRLRVA